MSAVRIHRLFIALISFIAMLSSCTPPLYNPNKLHAPMLNERGDFQIEGSWGIIQGPNFAVAYAIGNNFSLKGSASYWKSFKNDSSNINQKAYEIGIGTFGLIDKRIPWEAFVTFMNANSNFAGPQNTMSGENANITKISSDYWRISLQGNLMTNEARIKSRSIFQNAQLEHIIGLRFTYVNFFNYHEIKHDDYEKTIVIDDVPPKLLNIEISSILKFGAYPFFLEVQYGLVLPIIRSKKDFDYLNQSIFSVGASLFFF